jgi:hypothetical protein
VHDNSFFPDTEGHFVDAHVPTFTNIPPNELHTLNIPSYSKDHSDAFRSIMSPLTITGIEDEERGCSNAARGFSKAKAKAKAEKSEATTASEYSRKVWSGIIEGNSESPFKKVAGAINNTRIAATTCEKGAKGVIRPSTLPTIITGSSITGRTGESKKKGPATSISNKKTGLANTAAITTKAKSVALKVKGKTTNAISTRDTSKPMLKKFSGEIQTSAQAALCTADDYRAMGRVWCEKFDELVIFKGKFGHCNPPPVAKGDPLVTWIHSQRNLLSFSKDSDPTNPHAPLMKKKLDR